MLTVQTFPDNQPNICFLNAPYSQVLLGLRAAWQHTKLRCWEKFCCFARSF